MTPCQATHLLSLARRLAGRAALCALGCFAAPAGAAPEASLHNHTDQTWILEHPRLGYVGSMDAWERMPHESERLTTLTVTRQVEGKEFAATRFTRRFEISSRKPDKMALDWYESKEESKSAPLGAETKTSGLWCHTVPAGQEGQEAQDEVLVIQPNTTVTFHPPTHVGWPWHDAQFSLRLAHRPDFLEPGFSDPLCLRLSLLWKPHHGEPAPAAMAGEGLDAPILAPSPAELDLATMEGYFAVMGVDPALNCCECLGNFKLGTKVRSRGGFELSRDEAGNQWHLRGTASQFKFECCVIQ